VYRQTVSINTYIPIALNVTFKPQLIDSSVHFVHLCASEEFEERAYIKSQFFLHKLQLTADNNCVVRTDAGLATLSLSFTLPVAFTYRLKPLDEHIEPKRLSRYVLQEMTDRRLTYFIRPPTPGSYLLTIFAREFLDGVSPKTMITFRSVAEYRVACDSAADEVTSPFPYCSDSSWGLDMYTSFIGTRLVPNHRVAVVFCPDSRGKVTLKLTDPELRLYARLVRDGLEFEVLKRGVSITKEDGRIVIEVQLPDPGEYGLEVFVNDPGKDGKLFAHFCQYLFTTDTEGVFASVYKACQAEDESVEAEEGAVAKEVQETETTVAASLSEKAVVGSELDQEAPGEGVEDKTGVEVEGKGDDQAAEEEESGEPTVETVEKVEDGLAEKALTEPDGTQEPEVVEEAIVAAEKAEEESTPVEDSAAEEPETGGVEKEVERDQEETSVEAEEGGEPPAAVLEEEPAKDEAGAEESDETATETEVKVGEDAEPAAPENGDVATVDQEQEFSTEAAEIKTEDEEVVESEGTQETEISEGTEVETRDDSAAAEEPDIVEPQKVEEPENDVADKDIKAEETAAEAEETDAAGPDEEPDKPGDDVPVVDEEPIDAEEVGKGAEESATEAAENKPVDEEVKETEITEEAGIAEEVIEAVDQVKAEKCMPSAEAQDDVETEVVEEEIVATEKTRDESAPSGEARDITAAEKAEKNGAEKEAETEETLKEVEKEPVPSDEMKDDGTAEDAEEGVAEKDVETEDTVAETEEEAETAAVEYRENR